MSDTNDYLTTHSYPDNESDPKPLECGQRVLISSQMTWNQAGEEGQCTKRENQQDK